MPLSYVHQTINRTCEHRVGRQGLRVLAAGRPVWTVHVLSLFFILFCSLGVGGGGWVQGVGRSHARNQPSTPDGVTGTPASGVAGVSTAPPAAASSSSV